ncbi:hypothetical protein GCM10023205_11530 [Yinghuangia aomiensis]|uniref:Uncharacterized protein n=1 Tax=Yinghuangia aomiensis TaxID=676205 RepID=A0ABP9GTN9_9ACTN
MRLTDEVRALMQPNDPAPVPPDSGELPDRARYTLEDILVSRPGVVSTRTGVGPTPRRSLIPRSRRGWLIPLTVCVAASTGVAIGGVLPGPTTPGDTNAVRCYADTEVAADPFHGAYASGTGEHGAVDAAQQCTELWRLGLLSSSPPYSIPPRAARPQSVPPLVTCVSEGFAAVFPAGPDFCRAAGLAPLARGDAAGQRPAGHQNSTDEALSLIHSGTFPPGESNS